MASLRDLLLERLGGAIKVREEIPGAELTTFALGGPVEAVLEPNGVEALRLLLPLLKAEQGEVRVIGAGSNLLIPDDGVRRAALRLGREFAGFAAVDPTPATAEHAAALLGAAGPNFDNGDERKAFLVFGGTALMTLSRKACSAGYTGLEFAAGIPASFGGAVMMNAGAHGRAMSDVVTAVYCVTPSGAVQRFLPKDLHFGYRSFGLPQESVVFAAQICLARDDPEAILEKRNACLEYRRRTQPLHLPSAGSVFRNPSGSSSRAAENEQSCPAAAILLERAGLKGFRVGGMGYSDLHSNWIVKLSDQGRASQVQELIQLAKERVLHQFNIELHTELVVW